MYDMNRDSKILYTTVNYILNLEKFPVAITSPKLILIMATLLVSKREFSNLVFCYF